MFKSLLKKWAAGAAQSPPGPLPSLPADHANAESAPTPSDLKRRGNAHLEQGEVDAAAQSYRQALEIVPDDIGALVNLGYVLSGQGLFSEARPHLEKAAALAPEQEDAFYFLGVVYRGIGLTEKAIESYRTALDLKPDFLPCRLQLCRALFESGNGGEAGQIVEAGIELQPSAAELHYYLGNLKHESRELESAVASFARALDIQPGHEGAHRSLGDIACEQGRLDAALGSYRSIRACVPEDAVRFIRLSVAFHAAGMPEHAVECAQRATEIDPACAAAHINLGLVKSARDKSGNAVAIATELNCNLGAALQSCGRLVPAIAAYRRACALDQSHVHAHCCLGLALHSQGRLDAAVEAFERALQVDPEHVQALTGLAASLKSQGDITGAVEQLERLVRMEPLNPAAHSRLADALHAQGRPSEAIKSYKRALSLKPDFTEAHADLGVVLQEQGDLAAAIHCYQAALAVEPSYAQGHCNLGTALHLQGRLVQAVESYEKALALAPTYAQAHSNLGVTLNELGRYAAAEASYRSAIELNSALVDPHINLAALLQRQGKLAAARQSYAAALALSPDNALAYGNLGATLQEMGDHDGALVHLYKALALNPDDAIARNTLLFTLNYHPEKSAPEIFAAYREYNERSALPLQASWRTHSNSRDAARRLKVGYVSPDFRQHSVRFFLEPLLAQHDKACVEVFAYAELALEDGVTARYHNYADHWIPTIGLSDEALAERIRADGIDILVDLAGHTAKNRLGAFARKPAPVSLSYLGFGYTTGLTAIDYLLTDGASAPAGSEDLFAEKPWRLQTPGYAYRPAQGMGSVSRLPAIDRGFVTFGTLTRSVRVNDLTVRAWSKILLRVKGSRLVVDSGNYRDAELRASLVARFAAHAIGPERLDIGFHSPPWEVLRGMDIGLDCFPHNSGTTLFESLYMGVPFITLAGRPSVGRLGSSILEGVGHPEWIAHSEDEYVERVVSLASDLSRLAMLRAGLRVQMQASALMDERGFARRVETAYREMFSRWAASTARVD